jgi:Fe-S-cluster formation regulator IscX/YfhJ
MPNLMKMRAVEARLLHADGQIDVRTERRTNMKKLIVAFRNFANGPDETVRRLFSTYNFISNAFIILKTCVGSTCFFRYGFYSLSTNY